MPEIVNFEPQFAQIFERTPQLSNIKPSEWAEKNIIIPGGKGKLNYDFNPYCREIIDRLAPDNPARKIAVMKGSQITFSSGVIYPALGYIISEDPHNTYLMVGTQDLVKMAVEKLDMMIHGAKLSDYINYQIARKKNNKSGDTDEIKSFKGGYVKTGSATNPKSIAQVDLERIFLDDFDAMKGKSKSAGSFLDLIEMRAAANMNTYKLVMISTPLVKSESNIEPAFIAGDQRKYNIECPCCHEPIILKWNVSDGEIINPLTGEKANNQGGIFYETNNHGQLIKSSVVYICYKCGGVFDDKDKQRLLREGRWIPTAIPISDDYFSYHISSLYAPVGMFDWAYYAGKYIEANPVNQPRNEYKMQVLVNTCFGETYEPQGEAPKANAIQKNIRNYDIGIIPEQLSIADGNGKIVLITCAADLNGKMKGFHGSTEDDVRLDYEIVAWSENGASYSIKHGSIGTFIPFEGQKISKGDRVKWTYELFKENSVWPEFEKIIGEIFATDTGRNMKIFMTGLDCGHYTNYAYSYLDKTNNYVVGLKGDKEDKYVKYGIDMPIFKPAKERNNLYILQVGQIKDDLSDYMILRWTDGEEVQPPNFMNFPQPANGLYGFSNYFEHFESENRKQVVANDGTTMYLWKKVQSNSQNHFWDCRVYNIAIRDIVVSLVGRDLKIKDFKWRDYVNVVMK